MNEQHTYAGHTLAEIKAAAEAATPGPWTYFPKQKYNEHHVSLPIEGCGMRRALFDDGCQTDRPEADARFIAEANPATVLAMAARIEELEQHLRQLQIKDLQAKPLMARIEELEMDISEHQAFANEIRQIVGDDWESTPHGLADKVRNRINDLESERETDRLEGWQAAREPAAKVCEDTDVEQFTYCQVLHDDGPATLRSSANSIRAMQPPAEWGGAQNSQNTPESTVVTGNVVVTDWPHPDGFAGGLTERNRDGQDQKS